MLDFNFRIALLFVVVSLEFANAARVLLVPSYSRRVISGFSNATAPGTNIATMLFVEVRLTNVSGLTQSGTIEALPGSEAVASQVGRPAYGNHLYLCGSTTTKGNTYPQKVNFSVAPNNVALITAGVIFFSTYNPTGPTGHTVMDGHYSPILRITIDQDRGALIGTLVPNLDGPVPGHTMCDGTVLNGYADAIITEARSGVPLLLNGGRPF